MILPLWVDLYDFTTRVEWLGIGVWGNPQSARNWTAEELGKAFLRVIGDGEEAVMIRKKTKELGALYQAHQGGSLQRRR